MKINIVSASLEDFNAVNLIVKEGHDEHSEALPHVFKKVNQVMSKTYYCELLAALNCEILVAKLNEDVVGFAVMELNGSPPYESMTSRKYAYMNDFGVISNSQGQGIGSELFKVCVEWSKNKGATSLDLNVWEFNEKAIAFYKGFGMNSISRKMTLPLKN